MGSNARSHLRGFIRGRFPAARFTDDEDIFSLGFVTSLFLMDLLVYMEDKFGIRVPSEELRFANLSTVDAMTNLVERLALGGVKA